MNKEDKKKKRVLTDHHQVGKRFLPPFLHQGGSLTEVRWIDCILPELFWLGILNDYYGLRDGTRLALALAQVADKIYFTDKKILFASTTAYSELTEQQKNEVVNAIRASGELELLKKALLPLVAYYPECPLSFLFNTKIPRIEDSMTRLYKLKEILASLFDKWDRPAMLIQANAFYISSSTDLMLFMKDVELPNLEAIIEFPSTEESREAAAIIRATTIGLFGESHYIKQSPWPWYFWNRGLELGPCEYSGEYEEYE